MVARFSNLISGLPSEHGNVLGHRLHETYPAGSLRLSKLPYAGYKDRKKVRINFEEGSWNGVGRKAHLLARLANELRTTTRTGVELDHDEIDAVVCALTGVMSAECVLREDALRTCIQEKLGDDGVDPTPPMAYALMKLPPRESRMLVRIRMVDDSDQRSKELAGG